jgi:amidohydrolase
MTAPSHSWRESLIDLFDTLHQQPERSWQEWQTTKRMAAKLTELGWRVQEFARFPGFMAEIGPTEGPVVALRTDMDALWQEVDGAWRANHSCGHDAHMTIVYGAAALLTDERPSDARIRVLFQPAEEVGEGALRLVDAGALQDVEMLFGLHLRPQSELALGRMSAAIRHGAAIQLDGHITGRAAHAARPHEGRNPIETAAAIVQAMATIHGDPLVPHSVKMTKLHAGGESTNIVPDSAHFTLDVRAAANDVMEVLVEQIHRRIAPIATAYDTPVAVEARSRVVAAVVGDRARALLQRAIVHSMGESALAPDVSTTGGEDFHFYTEQLPSLEATMLGVGCGLTPGLHAPHMRFETSILPEAAQIMAVAARLASEELKTVRE